MTAITLRKARKIVSSALAKGREAGMQPLAVCVLDAGGHLKAFEREDGASNGRFEIARGKANGAIEMGIGSRALFNRAEQQSYFVLAAGRVFDHGMILHRRPVDVDRSTQQVQVPPSLTSIKSLFDRIGKYRGDEFSKSPFRIQTESILAPRQHSFGLNGARD